MPETPSASDIRSPSAKPIYLESVEATREPLTEEQKVSMTYAIRQTAFDDAVKSLGKISVEFQFLETEIKTAIGFFVNNSNSRIGRIVTAGMKFGSLMDLLRCLVDNLIEDKAAWTAFQSHLASCSESAKKRNSLTHASWYPSSEGGAAVLFNETRRGPHLRIESETLYKSDIDDIAHNLEVCRIELNAFLKAKFPSYEQFGK